jgi:hypothetical protein
MPTSRKLTQCVDEAIIVLSDAQAHGPTEGPVFQNGSVQIAWLKSFYTFEAFESLANGETRVEPD